MSDEVNECSEKTIRDDDNITGIAPWEGAWCGQVYAFRRDLSRGDAARFVRDFLEWRDAFKPAWTLERVREVVHAIEPGAEVERNGHGSIMRVGLPSGAVVGFDLERGVTGSHIGTATGSHAVERIKSAAKVIEALEGPSRPRFADPLEACRAYLAAEPTPTFTKHDQTKPRTDLLPPRALLAMAAVLAHGAAKYGDDNWRRGGVGARPRYIAAALRHVLAYQSGEELDPESGLGHLAHALTSLAFAFELGEE